MATGRARHGQCRVPLVITNADTNRKPGDNANESTNHWFKRGGKARSISAMSRGAPAMVKSEDRPDDRAAKRASENRTQTWRPANADFHGAQRGQSIGIRRTGAALNQAETVLPVRDETANLPMTVRRGACSDSHSWSHEQRVLSMQRQRRI